MKERIFLFFVICALLLINAYTLLRFNNLKQKNEAIAFSYNLHENEILKIYKSKFITGILNSDFDLGNIKVKDTLNNLIFLKSIFKSEQKQVLVCRFSQSHCESCVDATIQTLLPVIDSIGKDNVVFLGNHHNNRIFKGTLPLYNIEKMNVYNAPTLNLPAEDLGYPYFFILNSSLQTSNVLVHEKGFPQLTIEYLEKIKKRYF